ncbi:ComF family protein [Commensalibacter nepenthis]|uniref:ComF family protein n=1 Tax=Commensalibacter nepenthis TaxID=3043872 RepID=A0ABT6QAI3_9PROT|nr:ComF family protein [Commensalibacter sp. TBRC 10068]MDI2113791.1 ComF family protein [Commensalibacter sp. TBRC 10068]
MKVNMKSISGNWHSGFVMDKHTLRSIPVGENQWGHMQFEKERSEVGEALFQLKYRDDFTKVASLAECLVENAYPLFDNIGFVLPMPASKPRQRQPVNEIAKKFAELVEKPYFDNILLKEPINISLKDLNTKDEKLEAIGNSFYINEPITNQGCWNALIIDDLYHTGASMEKACVALKKYVKVKNIYVVALTWRM